MFEKITEDMKNFKFKDNSPCIRLSDNIFLSDENFKQKLENIDSLPDAELDNFVASSYKLILYKIANKINIEYLKGFTTVKFLTSLFKLLSFEAYKLPVEYQIYCNSIVYDYLSLDKEKQDAQISNLMFSISRTLNRGIINNLLCIGLPERTATYITLAYRSSADDTINIPRVNFVLLHEDPAFMTTQRIVFIYERLYNKITDLFISTICDVIDIDESVPDYRNKRAVYENEADAVVAILNNLPSNMIYTVLISFYTYCVCNNYLISNIRYSLRAMPVDNNNSRVLEMIDYIYKHEAKFIL